MDYAQKRLDYEQTDRLSTMTEEEKTKLRDRKAQGLQRVIERADAVLAGNKRLLEKTESERKLATTMDQKEKLRERKALKLGGAMERADLKSRERKALEVRGVMERAEVAFEVFRTSATGAGK